MSIKQVFIYFLKSLYFDTDKQTDEQVQVIIFYIYIFPITKKIFIVNILKCIYLFRNILLPVMLKINNIKKEIIQKNSPVK